MPAPPRVPEPPSVIGQSPARKEGLDKVTGRAKYVDDVAVPGLLHGITVRSPVARGILKGIRYTGDLPWGEFVTVTAADIPGPNLVKLIVDDQPILVDKHVNHAEEAVVLLAHENPYLLEKARRHVLLDIEPLPACHGIEDSVAKNPLIYGEDNVLKALRIEKGDVDSAWAQADHVVEGTYYTEAQEQLYIEPQGMIAEASPEKGVTVWGSMQCPYYVHGALTYLFGMADEDVRVVQTETGGAFGGKEDYPSIIAGHAALLSWKAGGRPVKIIYDREEDMEATTKRHPSRSRHRTAVSKDGKLLAMEIEFLVDGGAYVTLSPVVLSRGSIHATGPYYCPNVRITSRAMATNTPPHGAFRGFGAPQSMFATERHMDKIARVLGISSEEIRRRNFLADGLRTGTGQIIRDGVDMNVVLDRALKESRFHERQAKFARENSSSRVKRGMGLACFFHGSGFTGAGEKMLGSVAGVEATAEGIVRVLAANTEIGQGTNTIFAQVVADALSLPYERIVIAQPDTAEVPNSGPTVASRTCMIVGKLLETAAVSVRHSLTQERLLGPVYTPEEFAEACRRYVAEFGHLKRYAQYILPGSIQWDDQKYQGDAYGAYGWGAYVAQVAVDTVTYETRVEDFVAVQEIGRVMHPVLAEGQVEGGVAQGIGYALYEKVVYKDGRVMNGQMTNYIMPTSVDLPVIRVFFEEVPHTLGPGGAKGLGELPMDGPAPAILNAIEAATGVSVPAIPCTPERLMEAMHGG
ncbi:MAG: xanthine dehydrogenase family protein [Armatimonadetes bacterium]|nr:xanthine dehydrogenase family protein [Armatimonadota bacterium]